MTPAASGMPAWIGPLRAHADVLLEMLRAPVTTAANIASGRASLRDAAMLGLLFAALVLMAVVLARPLRRVVRAVLWPGVHAGSRRDPSCPAPLAPEVLGWPLLGSLPMFLSADRVAGSFSLARKGPTYRSYMAGVGPLHATSGAENVRAMDAAHPDVSWPDGVRRVLGPGALSVLNGTEGRRLRKVLVSAMTPAQLSGCLPDIVAAVEDALSRWAELSASGAPIQGAPRIKAMTLDVLLRALVGMRAEEGEVSQLASALGDVSMGMFMPTKWYLPGYGLFAKALMRSEQIKECFRPYLDQARTALSQQDGAQSDPKNPNAAANTNTNTNTATPTVTATPTPTRASPLFRSDRVRLTPRPSSVLHRLVAHTDEDKQPLSDAAILDNMLVFFFAGHETSASTLGNLLVLLARHPEWEQRLREEQRTLISQHGPDITMELLGKMEVADAVVRETLRVIPAVGGAFRKTTQTAVFDGYQIPAGQSANVDYVATHIFDRDCWVDPTHFSLDHMDPVKGFKPERWLGERGFKKPGLGFVPFGFGARSCVGVNLAYTEMKVFLAVAFRQYRVQVTDVSLARKALAPIPEMVSGVPITVERISKDANEVKERAG